MPKIIRRSITTKRIDTETVKFLHELSECVYSITQVIEAFLANPEINKTLHLRYARLLDILNQKIESIPKNINFKESLYIPPLNLLAIPCRNEKQKEDIYEEDRKLRNFLIDIENKRMNLIGKDKYQPHTGIRDEELKKYLDNLIVKKNVVEKSITSTQGSQAAITEIQKDKIKVHIFYNTNLGQFIFNDSGIVELEGKQKDTADCLVAKGKDVRVSWDDIHEQFNDSVTDGDIPNIAETDARKRSVRTTVTEINNHTKMYLQPGKELIGVKNNEYWLQYEVDKGR